MAVRDIITEQHQLDSILDGLPKEYSPFLVHMYGSQLSLTPYDVETLIYVQEAQLDKFCQELTATTIAVNISHTNQEARGSRGAFFRQ